MSYIFKAVMLGEESGVFPVLRDFLFRFGMRGTFCTPSVAKLKECIEKDSFPVVFIDHSPGVNEGFLLYESLRKSPGLELVPFFFVVGETEKVVKKYAEAFGAKGVLQKPFNPNDLTMMLTPLSSPQKLQAHQRALAASKAIVSKDYESALKNLAGLEQTPYYSRGAGIAIARAFSELAKYSLTEKKLSEMLKKSPGDLRCLCEIADLYIMSNKYPEAIKIFSKLESVDPQITVKVWEHFHMLVSIDDINGAAKVLERMQKTPAHKESSYAAFIRMMNFMGLSEYAPILAKHFPQLAKKYPFSSSEEAS